MQWVRGGHWFAERRLSPDGVCDFEKGSDGRYACLVPFVTGATNRPYPVFMPAPELEDDVDAWWDEVGFPAELEPYDISRDDAPGLLERFLEFGARFPLSPFGPVPASVDEALCELLTDVGPLEALPGVVPRPVGDRNPARRRTVVLRNFHHELEVLAVAYRDVCGAVGDRNELSLRILEDSDGALQETSLTPVFSSDGVLFDPEPLSLRAFLWLVILDSWGQPPYRLCKLCKVRFEVPFRPGQPPQYCEQHRNHRDRKRAERAAALRSRPQPHRLQATPPRPIGGQPAPNAHQPPNEES